MYLFQVKVMGILVDENLRAAGDWTRCLAHSISRVYIEVLVDFTFPEVSKYNRLQPPPPKALRMPRYGVRSIGMRSPGGSLLHSATPAI